MLVNIGQGSAVNKWNKLNVLEFDIVTKRTNKNIAFQFCFLSLKKNTDYSILV